MSQENVEIVQAAYRAINDADDNAVLSLCADDVEIEASSLMMERIRMSDNLGRSGQKRDDPVWRGQCLTRRPSRENPARAGHPQSAPGRI
jgi:ketosteroid isomerase-like protein